MATMKIKKGDTVQVIAGKDKGAEGKVIAVYPRDRPGARRGRQPGQEAHQGRHQAARGSQTGGIITAGGPDPRLQRDARRPRRQEARPGSATARRDASSATAAHERRAASASPSAPVRTSDDRDRHRRPRPRATPRLKTRYRDEIVPALREEFGFANVMQVPGLIKIVVNMGVGEAARDSKLIEGAVRDLTAITGQKPQVTKARKSIAQFKLREGMPIGAHVTLRGDRMWEFLDRLLSHRAARASVTSAACRPSSSTAAATTRSVSPSRSMFHEIDQDRIDRVARHGHHGRHHRDQRRRGPRAAQAARLPVQGELSMAKTALVNKANAQAEVRGPRLHPLPALRPPALGLPQVRPVPDLPARDGPPRRAARRHQDQLVTTSTNLTIAAGPAPDCRSRKPRRERADTRHDHDRPDRRHADPRLRNANPAYHDARRDAVLKLKTPHRRDPPAGGLHRRLDGRGRRGCGKTLTIDLKYGPQPRALDRRRPPRVSKPGLRVYAKSHRPAARCSAAWASRSSRRRPAC